MRVESGEGMRLNLNWMGADELISQHMVTTVCGNDHCKKRCAVAWRLIKDKSGCTKLTARPTLMHVIIQKRETRGKLAFANGAP